MGMLLTAPAFLFVAVFVLFPLGFAIYMSLTNWPLIGSYHFNGVSNYAALGKDPDSSIPCCSRCSTRGSSRSRS
jgi:multiple sugar transport system permease protein